MLRPSWAVVAALIGALVPGPENRAEAPHTQLESPPTRPVVFTQVPVAAGAVVDGSDALPDGSRIVSIQRPGPDQKTTLLTGGLVAAGRPDVSFDGERLLFVGRLAAGGPADVWEMNVDGTGLRRITENVGDCRAAIYLSTIYTIDAEQPEHQIAFVSDGGRGAETSLYTCRMDGSLVRRITFNPYGASDPCQLSDGRLLFSSGEPPRQGAPASGTSALFTVNTDGTDVFIFAGAHEPPARRGMPCETPASEVIYVESAGDGDGGSLVAVSRTSSLRTRRVVAADPTGLHRSPASTRDGALLVSHRAGGEGTYGLYRLDPRDGARLDAVYDAPQWHELDAVEVRSRPEPAGRSTVVDDRQATGLLYGLDAYVSDRERAATIGDGEIRWLQVFTTLPAGPGPMPDAVAERLLGAAPVEDDGSFHLRVPARTPLRLATLDAEGRVLQAMESWIWVMPREARGCIGCHEDRELSPPNRHVLALRKEAHPIGLPDDDVDGALGHADDGEEAREPRGELK